MKIAIDIRPLIEEKHTGVQEYLTGLLGQFFKLDNKNEYILFYSGQNKINPPATLRIAMRAGNSKVRYIKISNRILNLSLKFFNRPHLDKLVGVADVFFAPNINFAPVSKNCGKVITFHDLSFERHPEFFSLKRRLWHKLINPKKQAQTADSIIAVSKSTKADLIELYKIHPEKIKVIYSGINQKLKTPASNASPARPARNAIIAGGHADASHAGWRSDAGGQNSKLLEIKKKYNLPEKFILYLGTIEPRKNIIGLIKAFELFNTKYSILNTKYCLAIAGPKGWLYKDVFDSAQKSKYRKDIIFTGFIDQEDKQYLYALAELFVYPSFYEGFGFPPLEAMAQGTPTITSNISSLPEAVSGAAIMIDPYDIDEMARTMEMALTDKALREKLKEKGIKQAEKFSWEKCARETLDILLHC